MVDIQIIVLIFFAVHLTPSTFAVHLASKQQFITVLMASLVNIHHQTPPLWWIVINYDYLDLTF